MVNTLGHTNTVTYNGRQLRQLDGPMLAGATSARPLGARSGVRPGTPSTTATATSTTWTVQPFAGVIDFVPAAEAGAYPFAFDAVQTGPVTAAAGLSRVDILYVEGNDPAESAGTPIGVSVKYLAGVANGSGNPPATPARSFVIARINVPASGGGSPTVTWEPPYAVAAGGILPLRAGEAYPSSPHLGQYVDREGGTLERYDGSGWVPVRRLLTSGGPLFGSAPTAGASLIEQAGTAAVNTSLGGDAAIVFPQPFPNGVIAVSLQRLDFANFGQTGEVLSTTQSLSQVNFRIYSNGPLVSATGVKYVFRALGW